MVKRVDTAVHDALKSAHEGSFRAGLLTLGLKEDGVGWALDSFNRPLVSPAMEARIEAARAAIGAGSIAVADYTQTGSCPVQ